MVAILPDSFTKYIKKNHIVVIYRSFKLIQHRKIVKCCIDMTKDFDSTYAQGIDDHAKALHYFFSIISSKEIHFHQIR